MEKTLRKRSGKEEKGPYNLLEGKSGIAIKPSEDFIDELNLWQFIFLEQPVVDIKVQEVSLQKV